MPTTDFETPYWDKQYFVAGVDEAGRGPLAGPVVAAAVILPIGTHTLTGVNDSKKLSELQRLQLLEEIQTTALSIGISFVDHAEIDRLNIRRATLKAMQQAVQSLREVPNHIFIDGNYYEHPKQNFTTVIKGDGKVLSIAAASIVAKVERDALMKRLCDEYPGYKFCQHKGYSTPEHKRLLRELGPSPIHRISYAPVAQYAFDW